MGLGIETGLFNEQIGDHRRDGAIDPDESGVIQDFHAGPGDMLGGIQPGDDGMVQVDIQMLVATTAHHSGGRRDGAVHHTHCLERTSLRDSQQQCQFVPGITARYGEQDFLGFTALLVNLHKMGVGEIGMMTVIEGRGLQGILVQFVPVAVVGFAWIEVCQFQGVIAGNQLVFFDHRTIAETNE